MLPHGLFARSWTIHTKIGESPKLDEAQHKVLARLKALSKPPYNSDFNRIYSIWMTGGNGLKLKFNLKKSNYLILSSQYK